MNLGWVDFSDNDRKKVLEVIHLLSEKGAVDELGFGIIRDGFADYFFPRKIAASSRSKKSPGARGRYRRADKNY